MKLFKYTILCAALLLSSCGKGFLEVDAIGQLGREQVFADPNGVRDALYGSYSLVGKFMQSQYGIYSDIRADDVKRITTPGSNYMLNEYDYNYDEENQTGATMAIWADGYAALNNINNVIEGVVELHDTRLSISDKSMLKQYEGEAKVLRALMFLSLCNVYAQHYTYSADASHLGIPIPLKTPAPGVKLPRATVKETYAQIISDLKSGEEALNGITNTKIFVTADAAKALLSRVYLYMADYVNAEKYATEVLSTNKYGLVPANEYYDLFSSVSQIADFSAIKSEVLWQLSLNDVSNQYIAPFYTSINFLGTPSNAFYQMFESADVRKSMFELSNSNYMTLKYDGTGSTAVTWPMIFKVVRSAEIILNRAEANYHQQKYTQAVEDLKLIRARAYNVTPDAVTISYSSNAELLTLIKNERRKELGFEGHRIYDIMRYKESMTRGADCNAAVCSVTYPNDIFIMPIPKTELDANDLIKPNPTVNN